MPSTRLLTISTLLMLIATGTARSATLTGATDGTNNPAAYYPYLVSLDPAPVTHIGSIGGAALKLLRDNYANWTFNKAGTEATGTFDVLQYSPFALANLGGADFSVLYSDGKKDQPTNLNWIQIAYAHNWDTNGHGGDVTSVDSLSRSSPFYADDTPWRLPELGTPKSTNPRYVGNDIWKNATNYPQQKLQNPAGGQSVPTGGNLLFVDEPKCTYTCVPKNDFSSLVLDLYLVTYDWNGKQGPQAGGNIKILDGMEWGVEITCAPDTKCPYAPEPATWVFLATGLAAIVTARILSDRQHRFASHLRRVFCH
jgi:hypothetical protein